MRSTDPASFLLCSRAGWASISDEDLEFGDKTDKPRGPEREPICQRQSYILRFAGGEVPHSGWHCRMADAKMSDVHACL
jgi:hypothetical protein